MLDAARANQTSGTIDGKSGTKPEESGIRQQPTSHAQQFKRHVNNLKSKEIIRRGGASKDGKWTVIKPD